MPDATTEPAGAGSRMAEVFAGPTSGARRVEIAEPASLFEPGTPAENLYYIESGQVRLYQIAPDGSARLADILGPDDWFGISALASPTIYGARAMVVTPSVLWVLPAERLKELVMQQPQIGVDLISQLASRLRAAHDAAALLVFDDCNQRLIQTLLRFSRTAAATPQEGGDVVLRITHQQLAQAVGAARETVSLALTQLRQQNLLRTGRNRLFFNPSALQQFCRRPTPAAGQPEPTSN
jgi:CRP/FNR family transcriptional regulator